MNRRPESPSAAFSASLRSANVTKAQCLVSSLRTDATCVPNSTVFCSSRGPALRKKRSDLLSY